MPVHFVVDMEAFGVCQNFCVFFPWSPHSVTIFSDFESDLWVKELLVKMVGQI